MTHVLWRGTWATRIRIISGVVLMLYVTLHLLNIAAVLISPDFAEAFQDARLLVTRSAPGGIVIALAMLAQGRPFQWDSRMPDQFLGVARGGEEVQAIFRCAYDTSQGQVVSKQLCYLKE